MPQPGLIRAFPRRVALTAGLVMAIAACETATAQADQQALVDRATLTVNEILGDRNFADTLSVLRRARGVIIFPRVFKGGFIVGGEGGSGVLVTRDGAGNWSSPAFYAMGSASLGFQIGVSDSQVILFIMNDRALTAMLDSQFKFGADAGIAIATIGAGLEGSTTTALRADVVAVSKSRGLYAGISLEGSIISQRSAENATYYGRTVSAQQIVVGMEAHNPGADNLRAALSRFSQPNP